MNYRHIFCQSRNGLTLSPLADPTEPRPDDRSLRSLTEIKLEREERSTLRISPLPLFPHEAHMKALTVWSKSDLGTQKAETDCLTYGIAIRIILRGLYKLQNFSVSK